jgi:hypothetical protein
MPDHVPPHTRLLKERLLRQGEGKEEASPGVSLLIIHRTSGTGAKLGPPDHTQPTLAPQWTQVALGMADGLPCLGSIYYIADMAGGWWLSGGGWLLASWHAAAGGYG